jgi:hypothetical protein
MWFKDKKGKIFTMISAIFRRWKPKGKVYSLRCFQCEHGFLASINLEAPIWDKCMQKAKSLDSDRDYDKICSKGSNKGAIYAKEVHHSCYSDLEKETL